MSIDQYCIYSSLQIDLHQRENRDFMEKVNIDNKWCEKINCVDKISINI